MREEEVDVVELPSGASKRALYYRWCHQCGWNVRADARGALKKVQLPVPTVELPDPAQEVPVPKAICDWKTFLMMLPCL